MAVCGYEPYYGLFALITAAHILTQQTHNKNQARYQAKLRLVRLLYQRHWDKQRVINLFRVVDWLMKLPESLGQQLWQEIETIEESEKMQYITSVERLGIAKGRVEGRVEGESRLTPLWPPTHLGNKQVK
ncbi:MAG: hypothetical protein NTV43_06380 [Methylococcales bacterium]|nr:hypothetical protein [Methylococcales bacterium]